MIAPQLAFVVPTGRDSGLLDSIKPPSVQVSEQFPLEVEAACRLILMIEGLIQ
jgi:hypothetical protein